MFFCIGSLSLTLSLEPAPLTAERSIFTYLSIDSRAPLIISTKVSELNERHREYESGIQQVRENCSTTEISCTEDISHENLKY